MKKVDFLKAVSQRTSATQNDVKKIFDAIAELQAELLAKGEPVILQNIGKLTVKDVAEKKGVNPQTKEKIIIPARKAVKFKASSIIKNIINK